MDIASALFRPEGAGRSLAGGVACPKGARRCHQRVSPSPTAGAFSGGAQATGNDRGVSQRLGVGSPESRLPLRRNQDFEPSMPRDNSGNQRAVIVRVGSFEGQAADTGTQASASVSKHQAAGPASAISYHSGRREGLGEAMIKILIEWPDTSLEPTAVDTRGFRLRFSPA